jgi:hypothetical protein
MGGGFLSGGGTWYSSFWYATFDGPELRPVITSPASAARATMTVTKATKRSGFLRRGAGIRGAGPYWGTPPPKGEEGPNRDGG